MNTSLNINGGKRANWKIANWKIANWKIANWKIECRCGSRFGSVAAMILLASSVAAPVFAQQEVDPEWPCIQRLIMEVSPAVMWPIPVDETMQDEWRKDDQVRQLAEQLGDIETFTDQERTDIAQFAESTSTEDIEKRLSLLAVGLVEVSNRDRKQFIDGIKRYTRQQIAISKQIENTLNQLSLLEGEQSADDNKQRMEIEETLRWHERVYDQRERAIGSLCEEPVELEERLSEILREAAQYLP
ncbi:MAG: hypothetical protein KTR32_05125 [Granulosicoccus sp.]|nr:hypothetical protein [Granulosicoccus sp.]